MATLRTVFGVLVAAAISGAVSATNGPSRFPPVKEVTLYSPPFELGPGEVIKEWYDIEFPEGHIGLRSFNAELVDENFHPVPLTDAYLHHWTVRPFLVDESTDPWGAANGITMPRGLPIPSAHEDAPLGGNVDVLGDAASDWKKNCESGVLRDIGAWFGVGSETRHTNTSFAAPYAVETGNPTWPAKKWKAQIHAIDTRDTVDPWGCLECLCSLYDTKGLDGYGRPIPADYVGGYGCCYTGMTCKLKEAADQVAQGKRVTRYLKYTVQYVPWDSCVVPVRVYFVDVATCKGEYDVPPCIPHTSVGGCVDKRVRHFTFPMAGHVVFMEGHLHYGGIGINMVRQNNDLVCDSVPIFGRGENSEVGNEAGYVTGMGVCEFSQQEMVMAAGESVLVESVYSRLGGHTGVMGQFVLAFAADEDYQAPANNICPGPQGKSTGSANLEVKPEGIFVSYPGLAALLAAGPALALAVAAALLFVKQQQMVQAFAPLNSTP